MFCFSGAYSKQSAEGQLQSSNTKEEGKVRSDGVKEHGIELMSALTVNISARTTTTSHIDTLLSK